MHAADSSEGEPPSPTGSLSERRRRPKLSLDTQAVCIEQILNDPSKAASRRFEAEYEVLEVIGTGSFSLVKLGRVRASGLEVALKTVITTDPEHQKMARNEFDLIRHLDHPNIVKVFDFFVIADATISVVEFFRSKELQGVVRDAPDQRLPEAICHDLMLQLLMALDYLHQHRIIHRDIKPQNTLVSDVFDDDCPAHLKVIDFNVARRLEEGGSLTMTGTIQYAAPEVLLGEPAADGVDVWAAGLCLYYMLSGTLPFRIQDFNNSLKLFGEHVSSHPVTLVGRRWEDISQPCKELLRQCMAIRCSERPAPMTLLTLEWLTPKVRRRHIGAGIFDTEEFANASDHDGAAADRIFDTAPY